MKGKQTKGSGTEAEKAESESGRQAPVEQLWERSREGRKETNSEAEYRSRKGSMGNQVERKMENLEAKAEGSTGEATGRRKREERKGRTEAE